jgi:hypothetical protein
MKNEQSIYRLSTGNMHHAIPDNADSRMAKKNVYMYINHSSVFKFSVSLQVQVKPISLKLDLPSAPLFSIRTPGIENREADEISNVHCVECSTHPSSI